MKYDSVINNFYLVYDVGLMTTEYALNDAQVKAFMNKTDQHFDVIVLEQFFHDSWLTFAHKFKAPIVTIATLGHAFYFDHAMGLLTPWAFVPHNVLQLNDEMSFVERCRNFYWALTDTLLRKYYYMSKMQIMADRYFTGLDGPVPSVLDLEKNISLRIVNNHRSMMNPRPMMPGLIYTSGIHIKPPKALPNDIQAFLDGASEHGAIYFSFGTCIRSADMPKEKLNAFIETFRRLKQKVLWKFENDTMTNLPPNVLIKKWLPQSDILAHKNVVLFMTHGGVFGTQEGIARGVPMLFMPVYSDQFRNAKRCVDAGNALMLQYDEISVPRLLSKLNIILNNKQFREQAKEESVLYRDNPIDPMDEAMYWIEYVARHKGTKVFRSKAVHLPWYIYIHLDILAAIAFSAFVTIYVIKKLISLANKHIVNNANVQITVKKTS